MIEIVDKVAEKASYRPYTLETSETARQTLEAAIAAKMFALYARRDARAAKIMSGVAILLIAIGLLTR